MYFYCITVDGEHTSRCFGPYQDQAEAESQQALILAHYEGNTDQGVVSESDNPDFPHASCRHQVAKETQADGSVVIRWCDGTTTPES